MADGKPILVVKESKGVCFTAQETLDVSFEGKELSLQLTLEPEDIAPLFDGAAWAGTQLWDAAICMIEYLALNRRDLMVQSNRVLELGAGTGLPAMCCRLMGCRAMITEQPQLVPLQQHNIQRNFGGDDGIRARPLSWGREATSALIDADGSFELVIACDCIFAPLYGDSWRALADSIHTLLTRPAATGTTVLLSAERRNGDQLESFFAYGLAQSPPMRCHELLSKGNVRIFDVRLE